MAMRAGHLLKRAGREFGRNLIWMVVAFGPLTAVLIFAPNITLLGAWPFVGIFVSSVAAPLTVLTLWSGAHDETLLSGNSQSDGTRKRPPFEWHLLPPWFPRWWRRK